jgi:hypothetical protein
MIIKNILKIGIAIGVLTFMMLVLQHHGYLQDWGFWIFVPFWGTMAIIIILLLRDGKRNFK